MQDSRLDIHLELAIGLKTLLCRFKVYAKAVESMIDPDCEALVDEDAYLGVLTIHRELAAQIERLCQLEREGRI